MDPGEGVHAPKLVAPDVSAVHRAGPAGDRRPAVPPGADVRARSPGDGRFPGGTGVILGGGDLSRPNPTRVPGDPGRTGPLRLRSGAGGSHAGEPGLPERRRWDLSR